MNTIPCSNVILLSATAHLQHLHPFSTPRRHQSAPCRQIAEKMRVLEFFPGHQKPLHRRVHQRQT